MRATINFHSGEDYGDNVGLRIGQHLHHSKHWLKKAWNSEELGPNSRIFNSCFEHLSKIKSQSAPKNADHREKYNQSLKLSWLACWRALDFTVQGIEDHHCQGLRSFLRSQGRCATTHLFNREWYLFSVPLFDQNGEEISKAVDENTAINTLTEALQKSKEISGGMFRKGWNLPKEVFSAKTSWSCFRTDFDQERFPRDISNSLFDGRAEIDRRNEKFCIVDSIFTDKPSVRRASQIMIQGCNFPKGVIWGWSGGQKARLENCAVAEELVISAQENLEIDVKLDNVSLDQLTVDGSGQCSVNYTEGIVGGISIKTQNCEFCVTDVKIATFNSTTGGQKFKFDSCEFESIALVVSSGLSVEELGLGQCKVQSVKLNANFHNLWILDSTVDTVELSNSEIEYATFEKSRFEKRFGAAGCRFGNLEAVGCVFESDANFTNAVFGSSTDFSAVLIDDHAVPTEFRGEANFSWRREPESADRCFDDVDFSNVIFDKGADFANRDFRYRTDFTKSKWRGVPQFFNAVLNLNTGFAGAEFNKPPLHKRLRHVESEKKIAFLENYERAFRDLKLKMELNSARHSEDVFHRLEMIARRLQAGIVPRSESWISCAYDFFSGYGRDFLKPLLWLLGMNFMFAIWFSIAPDFFTETGWSRLVVFDRFLWVPNFNGISNIGDAFEFAFGNTVRPFHTFSDGFSRYLILLENEHNGSCDLMICRNFRSEISGIQKFISFFHSALSLILLFLALLGLRRRFQITG